MRSCDPENVWPDDVLPSMTPSRYRVIVAVAPVVTVTAA